MKFEQNWLSGFRRSCLKILTDGRTDGRTDGLTDDGRKVITIAHPEQSSGELITVKFHHVLTGCIFQPLHIRSKRLL